jgi:hypothetical protein
MCEQFKDQIGKSDAVFNELIRRASIFPYQSIEATEKNNEILADALGAHMDSDGSWSPGAKGSFVAGLDRLIDSATDDIYAAYPTSKGQITDLFQEYKRALSLRAIALASSAHRTTGMQIFNFVGRSMAVLRNAIATSSSIAEVQSKINYLTQALPTAPIS